MRVVMRPHHDRRIEPPPTLKSGLDAVARFQLTLLLLGFGELAGRRE